VLERTRPGWARPSEREVTDQDMRDAGMVWDVLCERWVWPGIDAHPVGATLDGPVWACASCHWTVQAEVAE
jgi:hypothetical protein